MKLSKLHVRNYRALRDVEIPLSNFVCLTGENNAGKSSVLQALSLFASGAKLASTNFFDAAVEVTITLTLSDVQKEDLSRLIVDEHRKRIETLVKNNTLELVRSFAPDGTSKLGHYTLLPKDARFRPEEVTKCLKGKKGKEIPLILGKTFPELAKDPNSAVKLLSATTQDAAKELIDELAQSLSADQKQKAFASLPTGGGFTLTPLLPEVIYIPAVKDLADDVKTTESSSFGKILGIVLDDVIPLLKSEADLFSKLRAKLNRVSDEFGKMKDDRLDDLKFIETEMQGFVRESFRSVTLEMEIPPPKLESIFSTARILVDDGTKGSLDTKGDGLRRAVVFAILRTYVTLVAKKAQAAQSNRTDESGDNQRSPGREKSYLLLYEEPELFLHPDAQRLLFEALGAFSVQHHVVVTTHSPLFLGPEATATFIRLSKGQENNCPKPFSKAHPIDLSELAPKDEFQMICFENNNAAFFSRTVVLVEGDSDQIVFPHIARVLDPEWICSRHSLAFVKIHGKGNIRRYRTFFQRFGVRVCVLADLDLLTNSFEVLEPDSDSKALRQELIRVVDKHISNNETKIHNLDDIKGVQQRMELRQLWTNVKKAQSAFQEDVKNLPNLINAVEKFFEWEKYNQRLEIIRNPLDGDILRAKSELLSHLRKLDVYVLSKGEIENYYPDSIDGADKPTRAQKFRNLIKTRKEVLQCCQTMRCEVTKTDKPEFEIVFEAIFKSA